MWTGEFTQRVSGRHRAITQRFSAFRTLDTAEPQPPLRANGHYPFRSRRDPTAAAERSFDG